MVMRFGMSEKLGPRVFGHDHGQPFLGLHIAARAQHSKHSAREIDDEIRRLIDSAHQRARQILIAHRDSLRTISEILLRRETLRGEQFTSLLDGTAEAEVFGDQRVVPLRRRRRARPSRQSSPSGELRQDGRKN
jgi:cell division protease FtsH